MLTTPWFIVGVLLLLIAVMGWLVECGNRLTKSATLIGEVVNIGYNWSRNGSGGFTLLAEIGHVKCLVQVLIVGPSPGGCNPGTTLDMKCEFIQDLTGKRVKVVGRPYTTRYGSKIIADSLQQIS